MAVQSRESLSDICQVIDQTVDVEKNICSALSHMVHRPQTATIAKEQVPHGREIPARTALVFPYFAQNSVLFLHPYPALHS